MLFAGSAVFFFNALSVNPIAFRKAKIVYNFGLSECNRVNTIFPLNVGRTITNCCNYTKIEEDAISKYSWWNGKQHRLFTLSLR